MRTLGHPLKVGIHEGYTIALTCEVVKGWTWFWWHAWAPDGSYVGQANRGDMLADLIAEHAAQR
ncbi:hypothetical protein G5C51_08175 [Streptomyces sp. A7024]|uniref:Uncharacterized protein n=1 Tax=Streptomyces coryli TaxID=1128680 RepID=A0A6G4TVP4_9ACTN|nr:hypothetical protein [Streptomyces coryli]NGN63883.1 hypothetical protein [Streptomyces coryli]